METPYNENKKTYNKDPNFSVVMRGACNAKCAFCFNKHKAVRENAITDDKWLLNLSTTLSQLPDDFYQISITGNEPMLSPCIDDTLRICERVKPKYSNILLTTNGTRLLDKFELVKNGVHHINISRHHYDEKENNKIFGGAYQMSDDELAEICDRFFAYDIDVSLNCVINDNTSTDFCLNFVDFAKKIGVYAVRFRKENQDSLAETLAEKALDERYPVIFKGQCPVCRTWQRNIRGLTTFWKASVVEPSEVITDEVYEIIFDTDGKNYLDWDRKKPFNTDSWELENGSV